MTDYERAAEYILKQIGSKAPLVGVVCGSGLSKLSNAIVEPIVLKYGDIPGFPLATVPGHKAELVIGDINGICTVCMRGRFHFYEGNTMATVAMPVRVMRLLGVKLLIVTNAAGGINPKYNVGDVAIVQDHFGMPIVAGNNPLVGINNDGLGPRFPAISDTYDEELQDMVLEAAKRINIEKYFKKDATYCFVSGPSYESRAECRFLRSIGGDVVGMSTVPEIIAGKHLGMKILCLSLVTNKVITEKTDQQAHASHAEVLANVERAGTRVESLVKAIVSQENLGSYLANLPEVHYTPAPKPSMLSSLVSAIGAIHIPTVLAATVATIGLFHVQAAIRKR